MPRLEMTLSELEIECLRRTRGFSGDVPLLVSSFDVKMGRNSKKGFIDGRIVPTSERTEWESYWMWEATEDLQDLNAELFRKYPIMQVKFLEWPEKFQIFRRQLEGGDKKYFERLREEDLEVYEWSSEIAKREDDRAYRTLKGLYGIIGILQGRGVENSYYYKGFLIPRENVGAVQEGVETGKFVKELEVGDLDFLGFILRRTREIRGGKTKGHNPRFSVPRIARECDIDEGEIRERMYRLTGVLCHTYGPQGNPYNVNVGKRHVYWDNWFIPHQNFTLAESIIEKP